MCERAGGRGDGGDPPPPLRARSLHTCTRLSRRAHLRLGAVIIFPPSLDYFIYLAAANEECACFALTEPTMTRTPVTMPMATDGKTRIDMMPTVVLTQSWTDCSESQPHEVSHDSRALPTTAK